MDTNQLRDTINKTGVFEFVDGLWFSARSPVSKHSSGPGYRIDDFITLNAKLEFVIPELAAIASKQLALTPDKDRVIFAGLLRDNLEFWENPKYLPALDNTPVAYKYLDEFMDDRIDMGYGKICLSVLEYNLKTYVMPNGTSFEYVYSSQINARLVRREWLDKQYEQWEHRRLVLESLGYEGRTLMTMLFENGDYTQTGSAPSIELPNEDITKK